MQFHVNYRYLFLSIHGSVARRTQTMSLHIPDWKVELNENLCNNNAVPALEVRSTCLLYLRLIRCVITA